MPIGTQHIVHGTIVITNFGYGIRMDSGGTWQLDHFFSLRRYLGAQVVMQGTRSGYNWLTVDRIKCLDGSVDERRWILRIRDRMLHALKLWARPNGRWLIASLTRHNFILPGGPNNPI